MGARVLVVDDDPWILRMVSATLEKKSYVVDTAREGRQALERARSQRPDVIITDVMMPVMDGWQFVHQLRSIPELAAIPVIFLTALGKDESRLRELGLGPDDYLAKPFRFSDLEKRVANALASVAAPAVDPNAAAADPTGAAYGMPPGYPVPYAGAPYPGYPPGAYPPGAYPPGAYPPGAYPYPTVSPYPFPAPPYPAPGGVPPRQPTPAVIPTPIAMPPPAAGAPVVAMPPVVGPPVVGPSAMGSPSHLTPSGQFPAQHRSTAMSGRLEQLGLSSLLVMMEMERKDGVLTLKELDSGAIGRIFIRRGQVVSARIDARPELDGRASVYEMLTWKAGAFSFNAMEVDMEDTVQSSTTHLLMEGARLMDEANR
jgi:CheY-like chemotaxis protein